VPVQAEARHSPTQTVPESLAPPADALSLRVQSRPDAFAGDTEGKRRERRASPHVERPDPFGAWTLWPATDRRSTSSERTSTRKVYEVDALLCARRGKRMSLIAFVTDQVAIGKILDHLGLSTPEAEGPPAPLRELLRIAEEGDGWGVPAHWEPA
jgi:hypothetical protein